MNGLEKRIEGMVSRIIDESKDLVDDVVGDMYYDGTAGIEGICLQLCSLIKDQLDDELEDVEDELDDELEDGEPLSDEMESDIFRTVDLAIKKNRDRIESMIRCALHEKEGT